MSLDDLWWEAAGPPESAEDEAEGFITLGGQSLAAARFVAAAREQLGLKIPLTDLLRDNLSLAEVRRRAVPVRIPASAGGHRARTSSPLAPSQHRLWVLSRLHPESAAYNVVVSLRLRGRVDVAALRAALSDVVRRHDALRASVTDGPALRYDDDAQVEWEIEETGDGPTEPEVERFVHRLSAVTIPMDRAPMLRAALLHGPGAADGCLVLVMHHIVSDQATMDIVLADLAAAYTARSAGAEPGFGPAPSFAEHAETETRLVGGAAWRADLRYWRELLAGATESTRLPLAHTVAPSLRGADHDVSLGPEQARRVELFLRTHALTPAVLFLGCLAVVLTRWSGAEQVVLGMPVSRRRTAEDHRLVGFLVETTPLLLEVGRRSDLLDVLHHVRDRHLGAVAHATPTFDAVVGELDLSSRTLANPLFQVWFNDLTQGAPPPQLPGVEVSTQRVSGMAALFDINLYLHRDADGFRLQLIRAADRVRPEVARELLDQCLLVLDQVLTDASAPPDAVSLVTSARRALSPLRVTDPAPRPGDDGRWSPARALRGDGDQTALLTAEGRITYGELDAASERLHAGLTAAGVTPGQVVEIRGRRTAGLATALLAGWRAGAVTALTDASLPDARLAQQQELLRPAAVIDVPPAAASIPEVRAGAPDPRTLPGASHVLFTSGSGGRPAGVVVGPEPLGSAFSWYLAAFQPTAADRFVLVGGLGHDPILRDLLIPLYVGASVAVPREDVLADPAALLRFIADHRITVLHATPALLELLVAAYHAAPETRLDTLRLVISGGAPLTAGLVRRLRKLTSAAVVNAYGTTETPQVTACHQVLKRGEPAEQGLAHWPDDAVLPHGRGVAGNELLVWTGGDRDAGTGEPGEIVVAGPGIAAGYLDDSGPADRFFPGPGGRPAFRTGDVGRIGPDGTVEFVGRRDRQIDIDGHRLDLAEVEAAALRASAVAQAVAGTTETVTGTVLALQVVPEPGRTVDSQALRSYLSSLLPRYAVPAVIDVRRRLATSANHKVVFSDTRVPPANGGDRSPQSDRRGADTGTERWLIDLIADVIGRRIGLDEHFFEAGLTSIKLLQLHTLLADAIPDPPPATAFFEHPTAREIAALLAKAGGNGSPASLLSPSPQSTRATDRRRAVRAQLNHEREGTS
ncbi:condensation domain-containing protein [Micromonospora eburnea]|uniref:condensation domain-containing protein n=1 Tax=Micromonospora eburnea TaxID=227316 RepID=UPI001428A8C2|nr:condensation domain-containing protein [Micromonospora eburnea]